MGFCVDCSGSRQTLDSSVLIENAPHSTLVLCFGKSRVRAPYQIHIVRRQFAQIDKLYRCNALDQLCRNWLKRLFRGEPIRLLACRATISCATSCTFPPTCSSSPTVTWASALRFGSSPKRRQDFSLSPSFGVINAIT